MTSAFSAGFRNDDIELERIFCDCPCAGAAFPKFPRSLIEVADAACRKDDDLGGFVDVGMPVFGIEESFETLLCELVTPAVDEGCFDGGRRKDEEDELCTVVDVVGFFFLISKADIWRVKDVTDVMRACR